jgi:hypothetical protein
MEGLGTSEDILTQPRVTEVEIVEDVVIANTKDADDDAVRENDSEFSQTTEEPGEVPITLKKRMVMYKFNFCLQHSGHLEIGGPNKLFYLVPNDYHILDSVVQLDYLFISS